MSYETLCPECEGPVSLRDPLQGEIIPCASCGADLEVVSLSPLPARSGAGRARGLGRMTSHCRASIVSAHPRGGEAAAGRAGSAGATVQLVNDDELVLPVVGLIPTGRAQIVTPSRPMSCSNAR